MKYQGSELSALLLDLDDTLLDNRAGLAEAQRTVAEFLAGRAGLPEAAIRQQFGRSSDWFWRDDERHRWGRLDMLGARRALLAHLLETLERPDASLAAEGAELYSELRDRGLVPIEGAFELLARLRDRVPGLALITNGAADAQRAKIERFELEPYFDVVVVEGEFGIGKPDASVFCHALATLGSPATAALMVGDNFECDVLGALGAGLDAVWIERDGRPPPAESPRPVRVLPSFPDLEALLEE